jgi:hypothetical protein
MKDILIGATAKQLRDTMELFRKDPVARKQAEDDIRKDLKKNEKFYIDPVTGCGNFFATDIHISKVKNNS